MTPLIISISVLVLVGFVVLLAYRTTRPTDQVAPRRRELRRVQANYTSAQQALHEVQSVLDRYRLQLDAVGDHMSSELIQIIRKHDNKMLENDK